MAEPLHARALAATTLHEIVQRGRSLSDILPESIQRLADPAERSLLQELCYGVLRNYFRLDAIAALRLHRPIKRKDDDVRLLVLVGLYQLEAMRVAAHAAVSLSVAACDELGKSWAKGLVNAILRNHQREAPVLPDRDELKFNHPGWLIDRLKSDWPDHWSDILDANNARAPMALRVNHRKVLRADYQRQLEEKHIQSHASAIAGEALVLMSPVDVLQLPAFEQGHVSVQDVGAQLAASVLEAKSGERILDACAAPGGKAAHLLETVSGEIELDALDIDPRRLTRVRDNLERLGLRARCLQGDAGEPPSWWDGVPYDRILLDAPCSASGVIRRHPDIKLLRRAEDIDALAERQSKLLDALWPLLKPGGLLVYATCSVFKRENELPLIDFLEKHDGSEQKIDAEWGRACTVGRQIFPGEDEMDGFYYARIIKRPSSS